MKSLALSFVALGLSLFLVVQSGATVAAQSDTPLTFVEYPTQQPPIKVAILKDGIDVHGHWVQTVRLTIQPGGTLADASDVVYGDVNHVDSLFAVAKGGNPHLYSPALMPVGQTIDLQIDPATTFVLQTVLQQPNALIQRFTNGVVNTVYQKPNGVVQRMMTFPPQEPTDYFVFQSNQGPVKVRPGGRLVDLAYLPGVSFADVVDQTFGIATFAAASDFSRQSGWEPTQWPPPNGQTKRIITGPISEYQPAPPARQPIPNPNPIGRARQMALAAARQKAGVYVVRVESFDTVYHVAISDPAVTASELSTLLYGSPDHRLDVARAAGFQVPSGAPGNAAKFDPHIFGRSFDLAVNFEAETLPAWRQIDPHGVESVGLVDGAQLTLYPPATSGPIEIIRYPTGYRRILYRPSKISLTLAQGLGLFHVAGVPNLPSAQASQLASDYAATVLWRWSPHLPREAGDVAESVQLVKAPAGTDLTVLVGPPVPRTPIDNIAGRLDLGNPFVASLLLTLLGSLLAIGVGLARTRRQRPRGLRW